MMAKLKINTDTAVAAAKTIQSYNTQMRDGFQNVEKAVSRLDAEWDGSAATAAINKFNEIRNNFCDARYNVLDNYVNFLYQQIGEGYIQTETVNKSLADQFK